MTVTDIAKETVKGLSTSPAFLLIAVLNVAMVGSLIYVAKEQSNERGILTKYLIDCRSNAP